MPAVDNIVTRMRHLCAKLYNQGELINPDPTEHLKQHVQRSLDNGLFFEDDAGSYCAYPTYLEPEDPRIRINPESYWSAVVLAQSADEAVKSALRCVRAAQRVKRMRVLIDVWPDVTINLTNIGFYPLRTIYRRQITDLHVHPNPKVKVITYTPDYAETIADLYIELLKSEYGWVPHISLADVLIIKKTFLSNSLPKMLESGNHYLDVALLDKRPVGFIFLTIEHNGKEINRPLEYSEFNFIVVIKNKRRMGVGQSLVAKSMDRIRQVSAPELVIVTTVTMSHISNPFWQRVGFLPAHRTLIAPSRGM